MTKDTVTKEPYKWGVVIIACMAVFIIVLDSSAMNVAITTLVKDLDTTLSNIQAIIALYALIIGSFLLLGSKIQDILGRKKTFLIGVLIYTSGTIVSTLSLNVGMLLLGWAVLEGIGAALILPATTTLVGSSYTGRDKTIAFGIWGGISAMGAAVGPIIGGVFTTYLSWRMVFGSEIIFLVIILIFRNVLSESKPKLKWKDLDIVGAFLSIISLILIVLGILLMARPDSWSHVPWLVAPGAILFILFLLWQRRRINHDLEPLSDISLLKNRVFGLGNIISVIQNIPLAGFLFIIPVFLQQVTKLSAFMTGVVLLPASITILFFSLMGAKVSSRIYPKYILMIGFLISAIGTWLLGGTFSMDTQAMDIVGGTIIFGVGIGLLLSQLNNITMSSAKKSQQSDASGFMNAFKNLGYSVGTALIGVLFLVGIFTGLNTSIEDSGIATNMTTEQIRNSSFHYVEHMQTIEPRNIPPAMIPQVNKIVNETISLAMKMIFDILAAILMLGFIISYLLPGKMETG